MALALKSRAVRNLPNKFIKEESTMKKKEHEMKDLHSCKGKVMPKKPTAHKKEEKPKHKKGK